ncbi:MAG: tetratricopeptide repeat protein, partial [Candidatus Sumerlaeota bacterium]|nr:tetratricopeptide repeat protein [Candidatus Sumerlaeota bacterium]
REDKPLLAQTVNGQEEIISWPNLVFDVESYYRIYVRMTLVASPGLSIVVDAPAPAEIRVRAPAPDSPEDRILGKLTAIKSLIEAYQQSFAAGKDRDYFERAVADFPQSRYTPYFLHLLGRSYTKLEGEELRKSTEFYERLLREYPDYPSAEAAREELATMEDETGQSDKACDLVRRLVRDDPSLMQRNSKWSLMRKFVGLSRMEWDPMFWMLIP